MKKALCVLVVLVSVALAVSFGSASSGFVVPTIVANGRFVNQSVPISTTTIVTPRHDALYRVSAYATITRADHNSASAWIYDWNWTDGGGQEQAFMSGFGSQAGHFSDSNGGGPGLASTIAVNAGTPLTFVLYRSGLPDNSAYSLYYTVEQLQ